MSYISSENGESCADSLSVCVIYSGPEHHGGCEAEGAVRWLWFTVSRVPVSRQARSSGSCTPAPPPYISLTGQAAERPGGGFADHAWLCLPMKQKLNVIGLPQPPSDVRVFY